MISSPNQSGKKQSGKNLMPFSVFSLPEYLRLSIPTSFTYGFSCSSCRKVFVFLQKTIAMIAKSNAELGIKLYLHTALAADGFAMLGNKDEFGPIVYELISQGFVLYEEDVGDSKAQSRNLKPMIGTLLACQALSKEEYEGLIPKAAKYSAKLLKKSDQCQMVALCAHLFYRTGEGVRIDTPMDRMHIVAALSNVLIPCNRM